MAEEAPAQAAEGRRTVPIKLLGLCALLLLSAMVYNLFGGRVISPHYARKSRPAALPLQRRVGKSRYVEDPGNPDIVIADPREEVGTLIQSPGQ